MSFRIYAFAVTTSLFFSGFGAADEQRKGNYYLTGVKVLAIERTKTPDGKTNDHPSDKLTHWIRFDVRPKFSTAKGTEDLPYRVFNPTVGMKLTLDKTIKFQGKEVPAGTDLLKFKRFNGRTFNVSMFQLEPLSIGSVRITRDFEIPKGTYNFDFEWTTAQGEKFSDNVKVLIDVKLP